MDSRLIFLHFPIFSTEGRILQLIESPGMRLRALRGDWLVNPPVVSLEVIASSVKTEQGSGLGCRENLLELRIGKPYRKPTQVGGHKCAKVYERTRV